MQRSNLVITVAVIVAYAVLALLRQVGMIGPYWGQIMDYSLVITVSAVGLSLIYGFTGQFSLGHAAFYGIGAYTSAFITKSLGATTLTFIFALVAGMVVAGLTGLLIGLPILRLRSDYLGIATLGFGVIVKVFMENSDGLSPLLGGAVGMSGIAEMTTFTWVFWVAVGTILIARNLVYSSYGRACLSVREDEIAADIMGIDTTRFKTLAFVMGTAMAGLAGGLYAHLYVYLNPGSFDFLKSFDVLLVVVLGGLGSLTGTVVTAIGWAFLLEILRDVLGQQFLEWRGVVYALVLIVLMIMRPQGLMGGRELRLPPFLKKFDAVLGGKGGTGGGSSQM